MYISTKSQNDKIYTMNEQEKNIYSKLGLEGLKTEMEILTNRREYFRNNLHTIEKEIKQFLGARSCLKF